MEKIVCERSGDKPLADKCLDMEFGPTCGTAQVLLKAVSIERLGLCKQVALVVPVAIIFPFSFCYVDAAVARDAMHMNAPSKIAGAHSALSM